MFVSSKKHNALLDKYHALEYSHRSLVYRWNQLIEEINSKGGKAFMEMDASQQLTQEEIKTLIQLCHPDKHAGKESAKRLTQKLLTLRN